MSSRAFSALRAAIGVLILPLAAAAASPGPVVISELMWAGSGASSADEWIELYNQGTEPVDLSGWTLTRGEGEDETVMVQIASGVLMPGEVFLISNYGHEDERSRLASPPDLVSSAVSLPNSKLRLRLYDGLPATASIQDEVDDGSGAPFGGQGGDGRAAMVRTLFNLPGTLAEAWSTAVEALGWDPGASELGTPGSIPGRLLPGSSDATLVPAVSWARVKRRRR